MSQERIQHSALSYIKLSPDPVPMLRILRDVLHRDPSDPNMREAKILSLNSRWIKALAAEQNPDGGWSRFHSMNTRAKNKIPTTEYAVDNALSLGLDQNDVILARAQSYLEGLLEGTIAWPEDEFKESNDRWPAGEEMFIAATLAMINPRHPLLQSVIEKWCHIAEAAFAFSTYDPEAEWRAHCLLTGATTMRNSYLVLNNRYALRILSCTPQILKPGTEKALLDWLWQLPVGVGYFQIPLQIPVAHLPPRSLGRWFASQQILSRFFHWRQKIKPFIEELWSLKNADGFWDFNAKANLYNYHLSESWRKRNHYLIDQSIHVLLLLSAYYVQSE